MTQPAKSQEPSMEEILASIRRIIADDDATKTQTRPPEWRTRQLPRRGRQRRHRARRRHRRPARSAPPRAHGAASSKAISMRHARGSTPRHGDSTPERTDMLELTESMAAAPSPAARRRSGVGFPYHRWRNPMWSLRRAGADAPHSRREFQRNRAAPAADCRSSRDLLSNTASAAVDSAFNSLAHTVLMQNARTLEDLVREMLRPMLKTWLDDNLPGMVERLVRAEIERVSRGRKRPDQLRRSLISRDRPSDGACSSCANHSASAGSAMALAEKQRHRAIAVDHEARRVRRRRSVRDKAPMRTQRPRCRAPAASSAWRWSAACCAACRSRGRCSITASGASHHAGPIASSDRRAPHRQPAADREPGLAEPVHERLYRRGIDQAADREACRRSARPR